MSNFESISNSPDILATPQEQMVMLVAHRASGIDKAQLDPDYFDFSYTEKTSEIVVASFTGRNYAKDGRRGKWAGTKTIEVTRAKLNRGTLPLALIVAYRPGMTMEHVLRALEVTYAFTVTPDELLMKNASGVYAAFIGAVRPEAMTLELKFAPNQARIVPTGSEFTIRLDNSQRPDINDYLHVIKAGSVTGGV